MFCLENPSTLSSFLELFADPSQTILIDELKAMRLLANNRIGVDSSAGQSIELSAVTTTFLEGVERTRLKSLDEATDLFLQVIQTLIQDSSQGDYPKQACMLHAMALNNLGYISQRKGEFDDAVIAFSDALSMLDEPTGEAGNGQPSSSTSTESHEEDLALALIYCNAGRIGFIEGNYEQAELLLSRGEDLLVRSTQRNDPNYTNELGHQSAESCFLRSLIRHSLTHVFLDLGEFQKGESMFVLTLDDVSHAINAYTQGRHNVRIHNEFLNQCISSITTSVQVALSLHAVE